MTDKEKKDVFLEAIKGAVEIKKDKSLNVTTTLSTTKKEKIKNQSAERSIFLSPKEKTNNTNIIKNHHTKPEQEKININKKIKKGAININKKIDLHGLSLVDAKNIFIETINDCFFSNKRCILFVTGKGLNKKHDERGETKLYYGKIRRNFVEWTKDSRVDERILSTEQASPKYGGEGAFFVYLRKNKN